MLVIKTAKRNPKAPKNGSFDVFEGAGSMHKVEDNSPSIKFSSLYLRVISAPSPILTDYLLVAISLSGLPAYPIQDWRGQHWYQ